MMSVRSEAYRKVLIALLVITVAIIIYLEVISPPFATPGDSDNYVSHLVAWLFVSTACGATLAVSRLWIDDGRRRHPVLILVITACSGTVVLDAIADVLIPVLLGRKVDNDFALPLLAAIPVSALAVVAALLVSRERAKSDIGS